MPEAKGIVHAPLSTTWRLLIDTQAWPDWGPSVRAVRCASRFIGPNVHGRVRTPLGLWLPFQVTDWEPETSWSWTVAGIAATGHRVTPAGPAATLVTFTVPGWALLYLPICRTALGSLDRLAMGGYGQNS